MDSKTNTVGKAKSRSEFFAELRLKANNATFFKILKIVAHTKQEKLKTLLAKIEVPRYKTFIVGEVFGHREPGGILRYHGSGFADLLLNEAYDYVISTKMAYRVLYEYLVLEDMMNDTLQNNARSIPMKEESFWATLYVLIFEPEFGKKIFNYELKKDKVYIFHVRKKSGVIISFRMEWSNGPWYYMNVREFDLHSYIPKESLFLFPTTKASS